MKKLKILFLFLMSPIFLTAQTVEVETSIGVMSSSQLTVTTERTTEEQPNSRLTGQLNLLGLRVGKSLGGYLEIGYGYKGIVNFGISYQF